MWLRARGATGAVGTAVALGRIEMALVLSLCTFGTLRYLRALEDRVGEDESEDE